MRGHHYARVSLRAAPAAVLDMSTDRPRRLYARFVGQTLRYGMPARRRFGRAITVVARTSLPERVLPTLIMVLPRRLRPEFDQLREEVCRNWPHLAARSSRLPPRPPRLSLLILERAAALTLFLLDDEGTSVLVLKLPPPGDDRVEMEVRALLAAEAAGVAPRHLGLVGDARVQEALQGSPLQVVPLSASEASALGWSRAHRQLASALETLGATTARSEAPHELASIDEVITDHGVIEERPRRLLAAARRDLRTLYTSVLRHGDTSPQNCLFEGEQFTGLVDWEKAKQGAPTFDIHNAAVGYLEHCVGLRRWSENRLLETFRYAWDQSPFFHHARRAAADSARAAGVPDDLIEPLQIAFYGVRVARRLARPNRYATDARTAAKMLSVVCGP